MTDQKCAFDCVPIRLVDDGTSSLCPLKLLQNWTAGLKKLSKEPTGSVVTQKVGDGYAVIQE